MATTRDEETTMTTTTQTTHCQCGEAEQDGACEWSGPREETVLVEYMPREHRASHEAAGASGLRGAGVYPHNGAVRLRVERACADRLAHLWVDGEPTSQIDPWVGIIE